MVAACTFEMPVSMVGQGGPGMGEEVPKLLLIPPGCCLGWGTAPKSSPALKQQFVFAAEFQLFQENFPERGGWDMPSSARLLDGAAAAPCSKCSPTHEAVAVLTGGGILLSQRGCPWVPDRTWGYNVLPHSCSQQLATTPGSPAIPSAQLGQPMLLYGAPRLHF